MDEKVDTGLHFLQLRSKKYGSLLFSFTGDWGDRDIEVKIHWSAGVRHFWICLCFSRINRSINWLESTRSPKIWLSSRNLSQASWSYIRQYCCPGNLAHVTHLHFPVITSSSCRICGEALPNQNETGCDRCFQYASVSYRPKHFCVMLFQYISPILSSAD